MVTSFIAWSGMLCFVDIWHLSVYEVWESEHTLWRVCSAAWARSWKQVWDLLENPGVGPEPRLLPAARPPPLLPLLEQCYPSQVSMTFLAHGLAPVAGGSPPFPSPHHCPGSSAAFCVLLLPVFSEGSHKCGPESWGPVAATSHCGLCPRWAAARSASAYPSHPRGRRSWNSTYFQAFFVLCNNIFIPLHIYD